MFIKINKILRKVITTACSYSQKRNYIIVPEAKYKKNYVFTPNKIPKFVNLDILKKYVDQDIKNNINYFEELKIPYRISDSKKAEWILSKSIKNSKLVGSGNANVDIDIGNKIGIDVSVLTLNGTSTKAKSVIQNFSDNSHLDDSLNKGNEYSGKKIVGVFRDKFINKCYSKKNIYYMIFVCENKSIYLSCLKINHAYIHNIKFQKFTKSNSSIMVDNFIDERIGNVRLYRPVKRLELRLKKQILSEMCSIKIL